MKQRPSEIKPADSRYWNNRYQKNLQFGTSCTHGTTPSGYYRSALDIYQCVEPHLARRQHERCFDIGCGAGRMVPYLMAHCDNYVGFDIADEAVGIAKRQHETKGTIQFHRAADGIPSVQVGLKADLFWSCVALQHFVQPHALLRWAMFIEKSRLPSSTMILIENMNRPGERRVSERNHIEFRTLSSYKSWMKLAGFKDIAKVDYDSEHVALIGESV